MVSWLMQICTMCVGHGRKGAKVQKNKFIEAPFLLGSKDVLNLNGSGPEEDEIGLGGALRLHQNFNSTSCAHCNNMIFLSAKNYREARVGGSSFLFCRDTCWEAWMAWFCKTEDGALQPEEVEEIVENPEGEGHVCGDGTVRVSQNLNQTQSLPTLPEDLKRTYSLHGLLGVSSGNRPLSAFKRTSVGIL